MAPFARWLRASASPETRESAPCSLTNPELLRSTVGHSVTTSLAEPYCKSETNRPIRKKPQCRPDAKGSLTPPPDKLPGRPAIQPLQPDALPLPLPASMLLLPVHATLRSAATFPPGPCRSTRTAFSFRLPLYMHYRRIPQGSPDVKLLLLVRSTSRREKTWSPTILRTFAAGRITKPMAGNKLNARRE